MLCRTIVSILTVRRYKSRLVTNPHSLIKEERTCPSVLKKHLSSSFRSWAQCLLQDDGKECSRATQMSTEPKSRALWGCGEPFICCLSQAESVLPGSRTGKARLKAEERRKGKIILVFKRTVSGFLWSCFEHYTILNWIQKEHVAFSLLGFTIWKVKSLKYREYILPKHIQGNSAPPLPAFNCWDLFVCIVVLSDLQGLLAALCLCVTL